MDLSKIKNLIKRNGDKVIVVENGEPELVVMSFKEYEKITEAHVRPSMERVSTERASVDTPAGPGRTPSFNKPAPAERDELGEDIEKETEVVVPMTADYHTIRPLRLEDIRLEDLPL